MRTTSAVVLLLALSACRGGARSGRNVVPTASDGAVDTPASATASAGTGASPEVPDVRGLTPSMARAVLEAGGLRAGPSVEVADAQGYLAGTVVSQRPPQGMRAPAGSGVELRVAPGGPRLATSAPRPAPPPAPATSDMPTAPPPAPAVAGPAVPTTAGAPPRNAARVPAVVGLSLEDATDVARTAGFSVVVMRVPGQPVGRVVAQDVPAGAMLTLTSSLGLRVSAGGEGEGVARAPVAPDGSAPADVVVPGVLDRTSPVARRILADAGLTVREVAADSGTPGRVTDQTPAAGIRVARGSEVVLRVAMDAAPTAGGPTCAVPTPPRPTGPALPVPPPSNERVVPSVLDKTPPVARRLLESAGFVVREEIATAGVPGRVMDQRPSPGEVLHQGAEVVIRVPREGVVAPIVAAPPACEAPLFPPAPAPSRPDTALASPEEPAPSSVVPPPASPPPSTPPPAPPPAPSPAFPPTPPQTPAFEPTPTPAPPTATPDSEPPPPSPPPGPAIEPTPTTAPPLAPEPPPPVPSLPPPPAPSPTAGTAPGAVLPVPTLTSPGDGMLIPGAKTVSVHATWAPVDGATGYLLEVEERTAQGWAAMLRKVVTDPLARIELEPADPRNGDFRWRVRTVVGKRGGRASAWRTFSVR